MSAELDLREAAQIAARVAVRLEEPHPRPLSRVLPDLAAAGHGRVTMDEIAGSLSDRGLGAALLLFAAPNLLPLPPGASSVFAVPLMWLAVQLIRGRREVSLPPALGRRSVDRDSFTLFANRLEAALRRVERLARPRYWLFPSAAAERFAGTTILCLALILFLPIPLGNFLPALSIAAIGLGFTERDGLWVLAGACLATASVGVVVGVLATAGVAATALFG